MNKTTYEVESQVEQTHWWFVGRRELFRRYIERLGLGPEAVILDIGTSTGTNLRMLKDMGFVCYEGLDLSDDAIQWCAEKGLGVVRKGDVCQIPVADRSFDLVLATDIIEHVDNDEQAIAEIHRILREHGHAIITVPAFQSLWGLQDEVSHHRRRYRKRELLDKLARSGLHVQHTFYFNYLLFVPIWVARQLIRLLNIRLESENQVNSPAINRLLLAIFQLDIRAAAALRPPFGVSIFAMVGKNAPRPEVIHVNG